LKFGENLPIKETLLGTMGIDWGLWRDGLLEALKKNVLV